MNTDNQKIWYVIYSLFFLAFAASLLVWLYRINGGLPTAIPLSDFALVTLATFRVTRLFVYDKITLFIRDFFQKTTNTHTTDGVTHTKVIERTSGPLRTAYELLICPWCFGVWSALLVVFAYFADKETFWLPILILAISGLATAIQLLVNMVGWIAETKKIGVKNEP